MSYFLLHKWAPRPLRLWIWVLIICFIAGGPVGLIPGLILGIFAVPMNLFWMMIDHLYEWSADEGTYLGARPSDKLKMSEKFRT